MQANTDAAPYPLVLEPILKPKVWGGRKLEALGKRLPTGPDGAATFGESWELADLASTSPSGGGGEPARSVIANGPLAGQTITDAMQQWGPALLGDSLAAKHDPGTGFPLLVKYLDAREHLSVQNHPSPAYAALHPEAKLKTESWVVLEAEPGSVLYLGVKPGVEGAELEAAIRNGTVPSVMNAVSPVIGACYTLPSGCVHALGAGILVAEVQTPSDTTYRLYDWTAEYNRPERELHVEQALASCTLEAPPAAVQLDQPRGSLALTEHYAIDRLNCSCEAVQLPAGKACVVMLTKTMGAGFASQSEAFGEVLASAGQTVLIPAAIAGDTILRAGPATEALVITVV